MTMVGTSFVAVEDDEVDVDVRVDVGADPAPGRVPASCPPHAASPTSGSSRTDLVIR
jgi:hypothetical protein